MISLLVLGAVFLFLQSAENTVDVEQNEDFGAAPVVTVEPVSVQTQSARVEVYGEITPRWSAEIRAEVSGRITQVEGAGLAGARVEAGQPLFAIDKTQYQADVANTKLMLAQAHLALLEAQNKTEVARRQFTRDGTQPPNDLALRLPQLQIATLSVATTERQLIAAEAKLSKTSVDAPFSGIVTERFVSLGQSVTEGDRLAKLVDRENFELTIELDHDEWALLKHPLAGQSADVLDRNGNPFATAVVRQGGGFLDQKTRQFRVFLDLSATDNEVILPGDFVRVILQGRSLDATLNVPATALTREGYVWHVDNNEQLQRFKPSILFRANNRVVIAAPEGETFLQVAVTPLAIFLPNQWVQPMNAGK
ncbi:efflux RND transporter periplasmic adaptor subunit [Roseovarius sp. EL26]|uniref:efflux RND transporter periplasmic adaptor subunit n=1 Tax=Roseovarius sp. EL26 TaxID=2126672 RepID=UPI0020B1666F|nr:efflux RND transporter periplasmic adaptor subunit [Roseovarius sp. EL26]